MLQVLGKLKLDDNKHLLFAHVLTGEIKRINSHLYTFDIIWILCGVVIKERCVLCVCDIRGRGMWLTTS